MLDWFRDNKDALIAIAALVSPIVAVIGTIIASIVSYRAVVIGPRTQRQIAYDTMRANRDKQWIADFRQAIAEVLGFGSQRFQTKRAGLAHGTEGAEDRIELGRQLELVTAKIQLMVSTKADGEQLRKLILGTVFADELASRAESAVLLLAKARTLIEQREARLPSSGQPTL